MGSGVKLESFFMMHVMIGCSRLFQVLFEAELFPESIDVRFHHVFCELLHGIRRIVSGF